MAVNLGNIFSLASGAGSLAGEAPAQAVRTPASVADEEKTRALRSIFGGFQTAAPKPKSYLLTSEGQGLFRTEESGNPATKRRIGDYKEAKRLTQSTHFWAFLCENRVVVFEKVALQEETPTAYLEIPVQSVNDLQLSEDFLAIEDKTASLLVGLRSRRLIFKGVQAIEDRCPGIGKPMVCKSDVAFYIFSASGTIQKYSMAPTAKPKDATPPPVPAPAAPVLAEQLAAESFLSPDFRLEEEISLPKGFKISSAHLTANDGLLLLILAKKVVLLLSKWLKPEGEFPLGDQEVHEAQIKVSPDGKNALILLTNFFDESLRSYYGENFLFLLDTKEGKLVRVPTVSGPIHNFTWSKSGGEFLAFSGHMPTYVIFYNQFGEPKIQLGSLYANFGKFSPDRRYLAVGASGNLTSSLLIYDNQQLKIVAEVKPITGAKFKWLPDSRRFTLSTCQDKLKVDNQVSMFRLTGELLTRLDHTDGQLFECMYVWEGTAEKDVQFFGEAEPEKTAKPKKLMNLKTSDALESIIKKESRDIQFISEAHIVEVNEELKRAQKAKEEEVKAKAKPEKEAAPKVVVLQKGKNFGVPRPKPEEEEGAGEAKKDEKTAKNNRKKSQYDTSGAQDPDKPKKLTRKQNKTAAPLEGGEAEAPPTEETPAPTSSESPPKTEAPPPKKAKGKQTTAVQPENVPPKI